MEPDIPFIIGVNVRRTMHRNEYSPITVYIKGFFEDFPDYTIKELFKANWTIITDRSTMTFNINKIGRIEKGSREFEIYSEDVTVVIIDDVIAPYAEEYTPSHEYARLSKAFFCVPPCPTCMMLMKLYPECSRIINGLIL